MIKTTMRSKLSARLKALFVGAVVLPAAFLSVLAVRAINREEAYVEKQYAQTLSAELVHVVGLVNAELEAVREELGRTIPPVPAEPAEPFRQWKTASALVQTPFLVSPTFEILWPRLTAEAGNDEVSFLNANREFVSNKKEIPVYQNIVVAYRDEIAGEAAPSRDDLSRPKEAKERDDKAARKLEVETTPVRMSAPAASRPVMAGGKDSQAAGSPSSPVSGERKEAAAKPGRPLAEYAQTQQAMKTFEENESLRQQVYQEAQLRGQEPVQRTVRPSAGKDRTAAVDRPESLFISEPKKFEAIIAGREAGLIPRFLGEEFRLLYWKRGADGRIAGCVIDPEALKTRLVSRLPQAYSPSRVLAVLDENGRPLAAPAEDGALDWRRPFVSREISELLPRWEAASYLADPESIRSRAHVTVVILWVLVLTFLVSILAGGALVLKTVGNEMDLARKKTTFVTNVSHELKTPLTSIKMFAEMLKEGRQPDPARRGQYLDLMVSETDRLTRLINNVLDFSRLDRGKRPYIFKPLEAGRLVRDLVEGQRVRLEHNGFAVGLDLPAEAVLVQGDEEALKQAVLNLLSNAEKYSDARKEVAVALEADDKAVFIRVLDRGIGVAPALAKKIFQEFYRADDALTSRTKGTGLGLPIARRLVRDHGGDIVYAPREGGGSVFTIRLPRSPGE
jgi:signal transduction histidine kinase